MLTENQRANINRLSAQTCIEIMHECAERIGLVDIEEAAEALGIKRRSVYDRMESGKLGVFEIGKHKFPCVNNN